MIDPLKEELYKLNLARRFFPRRRFSKRPDLSTMYRYTKQGCRGVVLESLAVSGTRCTSREAVARFIHRLTLLNTPEILPQPAARRGQRDVEQELDRIGI